VGVIGSKDDCDIARFAGSNCIHIRFGVYFVIPWESFASQIHIVVYIFNASLHMVADPRKLFSLSSGEVNEN
jgi:hypothetical protein